MKTFSLLALLLLFTAPAAFAQPIGEGDAPIGGAAVGGAAVGQEDDDAAVGGPAVGGEAPGEGDAPIGGDTLE